MSVPPISKGVRRLPKPANDNEPVSTKLRADVLIPANLPVTQVEVEVFAKLLDFLSVANDNAEGEQ